jgi:hypothetical protein
MRPKFVFGILLAAIFIVGAVVFFKKKSPLPGSVSPVSTANVSSAPAPAPAPVVVERKLTPEEQRAAIEAEKDRLYDWSMNSDPQSLSNILGDLISPHKEIRLAAIEAAKQFDDTNAIPVLKSLAANILANSANTANADANDGNDAPDNQEAIKMIQAADFIALPSVTWVKADPNKAITPEQQQMIDAGRARATARRQATMQKHKTNAGSITFPDALNPQTSPTNP